MDVQGCGRLSREHRNKKTSEVWETSEVGFLLTTSH